MSCFCRQDLFSWVPKQSRGLSISEEEGIALVCLSFAPMGSDGLLLCIHNLSCAGILILYPSLTERMHEYRE
ncbi:hypothetical protein I7I50_01731 [Histoplasma capsulatum G186AR]|uniref:Uncharacterized protein n=1 Tax=Ajellomyces capsulatus TaxID=5037 RepID=A0A8H7YEP5_AJECA|nr:hypothetical protein I7I52_11945 [Histoplasma capsulatum]QSS71026.1 hypothetical protein I7I50_01731 [Histoplasma capsulatum G186AR]